MAASREVKKQGGLLLMVMRYLAVFVFVAAALAQEPSDLIFRQKEAAGWVALGEGSELHGADGAMVFNYQVASKKFAGAVIGAPEGFARMRSIRFSVSTDHDTALAVVLNEKKPGGGNYAAWFWAPKGVKQQIELTAGDFSVTDGKDDPVDADGKLDLDQVEGMAIVDLAQFFLAAPANNMPLTIAQEPGKHSLTVQDFAVLATAPTRAAGVSVDAFDRGFLDWVAIGGMKLERTAANNPLGEPAMQASYQQMEGQLGLLVRRIANPALAKAKRLSFDVASEREATLIVALEMRKEGGGEGPRFTLPIYPPGGKELFHVDLALSDFSGPSGAFDPALWRSIAIIDATAAAGGAPEEKNTIWIGKMDAR